MIKQRHIVVTDEKIERNRKSREVDIETGCYGIRQKRVSLKQQST